MKEPRTQRGSPNGPRPRGYWAIGPKDSHSLKRQHFVMVPSRRRLGNDALRPVELVAADPIHPLVVRQRGSPWSIAAAPSNK